MKNARVYLHGLCISIAQTSLAILKTFVRMQNANDFHSAKHTNIYDLFNILNHDTEVVTARVILNGLHLDGRYRAENLK